MACLMRMGAYSVMPTCKLSAAAMATPCARPEFEHTLDVLAENGDSKATSEGRYSSTSARTLSKM